MEEWKEVRLDSLVNRKICYGIVQPGFSPKNGIPVIKVNNVVKGLRDVSECDKTTEEISNSYKRTILKGGELIISLVGTVGCVDIAPSSFAGANLVRATGMIDIEDELIKHWVLYYIRTRQGQQYIEENLNTTVQRALNIKDLCKMPIPITSKHYMRRIVSILKSLDDKIEVNRKINVNLEQQAQALFKSWFVDFEPFKNGEFVESELGMIPKGWRVGTVNDVCCFESGFAFKSTTYKQEGEYRLITIKNVQDGYLDVNGSVCLDELPAKMPQYCLLRIGDILLSLTGNVGRCCFVDEERLLLNQRVAKLKPRIKNNWGYIYTLFRNPSFKDRVVSIARGTAQANLSPIETSNMIIIIPIDKVLEDFSAIVDESYRIMINNMIESRRLATLRDTLLPKLMSGELKVNECLI